MLELENELRAFDVRFVTLKGVVEIVPRKLNKGLLVKKVLRDNSALKGDDVDFILCMGDLGRENVHGTCMVGVVAHGGFALIPHMRCDFLLFCSPCFLILQKLATRRMRNPFLP